MLKKMTAATTASALFTLTAVPAYAVNPTMGDNFNLVLGLALGGGAILLIVLALLFTKKKKR